MNDIGKRQASAVLAADPARAGRQRRTHRQGTAYPERLGPLTKQHSAVGRRISTAVLRDSVVQAVSAARSQPPATFTDFNTRAAFGRSPAILASSRAARRGASACRNQQSKAMCNLTVVRRLAGAAALVLSVAAAAHPHVWIRYAARVQMQGTAVTAIAETWRFSAGFPVQIVGIDTLPDNGPLDARQTEIFRKQAFSSLEGAQYFSHLFVNGEAQPFGEPTGFRVSIDHGKLVYTFTLPLKAPVDASSARKVSLGIWDDSFFVDYEPNGTTPVTLEGRPAATCTAKAFQDRAHPIFNGLYLPQAFALSC
ncbi:DUF1007 family protein [Burkholderia glumae]|uniref:DUF1007 family protein n=1 Tax=Burkholderia glumae TaxID=337 RepID=UPI0020B239A0|nr:DUF1007 family protein [Burkholderia glumae]MCQ0034018.1 DUF1007 family protein [Burkholderia glumae]MCQ0039901.1 DUF1007 family protein [Burkholderia glumae]